MLLKPRAQPCSKCRATKISEKVMLIDHVEDRAQLNADWSSEKFIEGHEYL
jgi:hypothetical protein